MSRYHPLVVVLAALATGIVSDGYSHVAVYVWWAAGTISLLTWWVTRHGKFSAWFILLAVFACGAAWHQLRWNYFLSDDLGRYARPVAAPVCVEAVALSPPRLVPAPAADPLRTIAQVDQSRLEVSLKRLRNGNHWQSVSGVAILIVDGHLLDIASGDRLRITAQLSQQRGALNPGQTAAADYERSQRRLCRLTAAYPDCVTVQSRSARWSVRHIIPQLRSRSSAMLWRHLSHERSGLAAAVLLGAREQLPRDRIDAFFHTGTIHLLAISGLHVGILASVFFLMARTGWPSPRAALVTAMFCTVIYALLTDARAPVVRATILVCIVCTGWILRRPNLVYNSLAMAAILVLALNPCELFRAGAQLSFLAVSALAWFGPRWASISAQDALGKLVSRSRSWPERLARAVGWKILGLTAASTLIWTITVPLVMYRFHLVTPAALLLNVLLWLPIALALLSGFAVLVTGWLFPPLAGVCGRTCDMALWVLESCVQTAEPVHGSHFWVAGPPLWWVLGFYGALGCLAALPRWQAKWKWSLTLAILWIALGAAPAPWRQGILFQDRNSTLQCTFLAVGHGTCVVLELPGGEIVLYDSGSLGSPHVCLNAISSFLWWRGVHHVDKVVLSHADADHYNALPGLLERFSIGAVYVSPVMFAHPNDALQALRCAIENAHVPIRQLQIGNLVPSSGPAQLRVLHPPRCGVAGNDNANSIVLEILHAGRRILLPGDLENAGLDTVLHRLPLDCDLVMAPHHGSPHSQPARFARWCTPEWVVISGGHRAGDQTAAGAFRTEGIAVMNTATDGAIRVTIDRTGVKVARWRES